MNGYLFSAMRALAICTLVIAAGSTGLALTTEAQDKGDKAKDKTPQMSEAESKALGKIESAADPNAKLQAATEFVKKYPKSTQRANVVGHVGGEVSKVQDLAQRVTLLENMLTVFNQPADAAVINPMLLDAYVNVRRFDDFFRVGAGILAKTPNDVPVLTQLAIVGADQAKANNPKYIPQSLQYGGKAIELIEAGTKPENMDDARWSSYQTKWLPQLYLAMGVASMVSGNKAEAKVKIEKAIAVNPTEAFSYFLIGMMANEEYQQLVEQHKTLGPGPLKDTVQKQAVVKLDQIIDLWAHVVALSEGKAGYEKLHDQILQDLTEYYTYRNKSKDGLQQLIDKYKKQ